MRADFTRRQFLGSTGMGLAALGFGACTRSVAAEVGLIRASLKGLWPVDICYWDVGA
jgi:hypothetical protein